MIQRRFTALRVIKSYPTGITGLVSDRVQIHASPSPSLFLTYMYTHATHTNSLSLYLFRVSARIVRSRICNRIVTPESSPYGDDDDSDARRKSSPLPCVLVAFCTLFLSFFVWFSFSMIPRVDPRDVARACVPRQRRLIFRRTREIAASALSVT